MANADFSEMPEVPVVNYPRRRRTYSGMFARWYVAIGAINVVLGLATIAASLFNLILSVEEWQRNSGRFFQFPAVVLIMAGFVLTTSVLILAGSIGSFWRRRWALNLIRAGLAGDLTVCVGAAVFLLRDSAQFSFSVLAAIMTGIVMRIVWVIFSLRSYANIRADFYFDFLPPALRPNRPLPITIPEGVPILPKQSKEKFRISAIDAVTRERVWMTSRATTEVMARKFAITMGMSEDSIEVAPLD